MSEGERARHYGEPDATGGVRQELGEWAEKLIRLLAELYNENTVLRHRVRTLEREVGRASEGA
jgi:hypothetical protein